MVKHIECIGLLGVVMGMRGMREMRGAERGEGRDNFSLLHLRDLTEQSIT